MRDPYGTIGLIGLGAYAIAFWTMRLVELVELLRWLWQPVPSSLPTARAVRRRKHCSTACALADA